MRNYKNLRRQGKYQFVSKYLFWYVAGLPAPF